MDSIQAEVAKTLLAKMFSEAHFSICVIDKILAMSGGVPPKREYDMLRALHCVNYRDMSQRLRLELPRLVQVVVESQPICMEFGDRIVSINPDHSQTKLIEGS